MRHEKENRSPNLKYSRSYLPSQTKYGRPIVDPRNFDPYVTQFIWPDPTKKNNYSGFNLTFFFVRGEVIPVFKTDELMMKPVISRVSGYGTPSRTQAGVTKNNSPFLETLSPRHRQFKRVAAMTATRKDAQTEIEFFQEQGTAQRRFKKYPPVVHRSPSTVFETLETPDSAHKRAKRYVDKSDVEAGNIKKRKLMRQNPRKLFGNNSGNEIAHSQTPKKELNAKYALSHLDQVSTGGEDTRDQVIVSTEGHNIKRLATVEVPASTTLNSPVSTVEGLHYESEVDLMKDRRGSPTHIGGNLEVSLWASPKKSRSIQIELNPQNDEFPTKTLHEMSKGLYETLFSSSQQEVERDEEMSFSR